MGPHRTRTLRGALAGGIAAGAWAAQQPLDKRLFGLDYDDVELLGRVVAPGAAGYGAGLAMHLANGALFGAIYASARPAIPAPPALRGPIAGLAEHLVTWPGTLLLDRVPAWTPLPRLWGSWRGFAQATWRHLLFGAVLGEIERRLNRAEPEGEPMTAATAATNGHGSVEHMATTPHGP
jgi:hypothetical protein